MTNKSIYCSKPSCGRRVHKNRYYCLIHIIPSLINRGRRLIRRYIEIAKPLSEKEKQYLKSVTIYP